MTKMWMKVVMVVMLVVPAGLFAGEQKEKDKDKENKDPPEMSVEAYDSKTEGAVQVVSVNPKTGQWFFVLKDNKQLDGYPRLLNVTAKLAPGSYVVEVNRTQRKVEIAAGKKTILRTGELVVAGKPEGTLWVPMQGKETRLSNYGPTLNYGAELFAGKYSVHVNAGLLDLKDIGTAEVKPGVKTVVKYTAPEKK
jgi:hypothetical protein